MTGVRRGRLPLLIEPPPPRHLCGSLLFLRTEHPTLLRQLLQRVDRIRHGDHMGRTQNHY